MSPPRISPARAARGEPDMPDSPSSTRPPPSAYSSHSTRSSVSYTTPSRMPSIAEDEAAYRAYRSSIHPGIQWPRQPLRVPQKSPRRALIRAQQEHQRQLERERLAAERERAQAEAEAEDGSGKKTLSGPPPYGTQLPPRYREARSDESGSDGEKAVVAAADEPPPTGWKSWRQRQWFGRRRTRWCFFLVGGLLLVAIVVGLSVGLTLGLKKG